MFVVHAFREGGPFMYVILLFGLLTLGFIIERLIFLYGKLAPIPEELVRELRQSLSRGDIAQAESWSMQTRSPLGKIVARGCQVLRHGGSEEEVQARMDEELSRAIHRIDKRASFLSMFGNVATLVGLLGTIAGMIHSFAAVAQANPMDRATLLSRGIAEAMNCTAFGLIVAVPALVTYAVFQNKTEQVIQELTQATSEIYHDLVFLFDRGVSVKRRTSASPSNEIQV